MTFRSPQADQGARCQPNLPAILLALVLFLIGAWQCFHPGKIAGDLGDARFNLYLLEHAHRWFFRIEHSFWSAPFFYPARLVITYSDNHLGSFVFYSLFRVLGSSRETAFQEWLLTMFGLNFLVTWIVLRRQQLSALASSLGAYLFTYGLPMIGQIGHPQLAPRFMIPLAFLITSRLLASGRPIYAYFLAIVWAFQVYLGIYLGYFLGLVLASFGIGLVLANGSWRTLRLNHSGAEIYGRKTIHYVFATALFFLLLLPLVRPYRYALKTFGPRTWAEVSTMLPRLQSYFYQTDSIIWERLSYPLGQTFPMAWEHKLFWGAVPWLLLTVFLILLRSKRFTQEQSRLGIAAAISIAGSIFLTLSVGGYSIYYWVWRFVPGAGGIRAVTRINLVLLYPVALILALTIDQLLRLSPFATNRKRAVAFGGLLTAALLLDQGARVEEMSKRECKERIKALCREIKNVRHGQKVFWVDQLPGEQLFFVTQLDAMLAGQQLGLKVVNGYSATFPPGYPNPLFFFQGDVCAGLREWHRLHSDKVNPRSLLQVRGDCDIGN
jgi:hypothetical protein